MFGPTPLVPVLAAGDVDVPLRRPAGVTYRRLVLCGLTPTEAGNLTARLAGIQGVASGWTIHQIEHLLFLRSLVERGRLPS
jgi:hypothetical protein